MHRKSTRIFYKLIAISLSCIMTSMPVFAQEIDAPPTVTEEGDVDNSEGTEGENGESVDGTDESNEDGDGNSENELTEESEEENSEDKDSEDGEDTSKDEDDKTDADDELDDEESEEDPEDGSDEDSEEDEELEEGSEEEDEEASEDDDTEKSDKDKKKKTQTTGAGSLEEELKEDVYGELSGEVGYQVIFGTDSEFNSYNTVVIPDGKCLTNIVSGLPKGGTYHFRVRSYAVFEGKIYYSKWSATSSITITK